MALLHEDDLHREESNQLQKARQVQLQMINQMEKQKLKLPYSFLVKWGMGDVNL